MAIDRGSQIVTIRFHRPVDSDVVNKRFQNIRMLGIYKGGRMSWSASTVTLSPLVCEISDGTHQVRVETMASVSQVLPNGQYLVLRWAYTGAENTDFMEILSVASPETNDVIVGKIESSLVVYTERTTPDTHHLFLRVEEMETPSSSVRVRSGVGHAGSIHSPIIDQILDLSAYSSGNIVYVYVTDTGGLGRTKTPSTYAGKALLAKIVYPADGIIENSDIEDVRSFVTSPAIPDESSITRTSSGKLQVKNLGITNAKINSNVPDGVTIEKDGSTKKLQIIPALFTNNLSVPGYQKLLGGLIMQWGTDGALSSQYEYSKNIVFSIPFPNAIFGVWVTARTVQGQVNGVCVSSKSSSGFTLYNADYGPVTWFAIGY